MAIRLYPLTRDPDKLARLSGCKPEHAREFVDNRKQIEAALTSPVAKLSCRAGFVPTHVNQKIPVTVSGARSGETINERLMSGNRLSCVPIGIGYLQPVTFLA